MEWLVEEGSIRQGVGWTSVSVDWAEAGQLLAGDETWLDVRGSME